MLYRIKLTFYFFQVLKKANKFSVVFDEAEEELQQLKESENFLTSEPIDENSSDSTQSGKSKKYDDEIVNKTCLKL